VTGRVPSAHFRITARRQPPPATAAVSLLVVFLAVLAGCGSDAPVTGGGRVVGDAVTVYSSLPDPGRGVGRDLVEAEKLALLEADGEAGGLDVNFVSLDEGSSPAAAASAAEDAIRDPQAIAVIGALRSQAALTSVPLLNAAGYLHVSPGAGYAGFTEPIAPGEPERWQPSGRITFDRMIADDEAQAAALLAAARRAGGSRVAVEAEAGKVAEALVAAVRRADADDPRVRLVADPERADAVIYAGADLESAAGVTEALSREAPGAALVLPDELTRAGIAGRLAPAARRRAVLVSSAPEPGSTPELREFEAAFAERFGRRPGPYAVLGHEAMRRVLEAMNRAAPRANLRRVVIGAWFDLPPVEKRFTVFRPADLLAQMGH
jgi:branched-chain amino acid transport system substrate-binding protein